MESTIQYSSEQSIQSLVLSELGCRLAPLLNKMKIMYYY